MSLSWSRWVGIIVKEFIQLKRDRLTFGMIIGIPVLQLILFGYAINADPKRLPTAVLSAVLKADACAGLLLRRVGIAVPGLSNYAICRTSA